MTNSEPVSNGHHLSSDSHRRVSHSTTLNRKYVKRPTAMHHPQITSTAKKHTEALQRRQALAEQINRERLAAMKSKSTTAKTSAPATKTVVRKAVTTSADDSILPPSMHPLQRKIISKKDKVPALKEPISAKAQKDAAIKQALASVASMDSHGKKKPIAGKLKTRRIFSVKKVAIALSCAALAVIGISYIVSLNMPDVSVRVAAMQTGIEASYPTYIPRGYSLANISSEAAKLVMSFTNSNGDSFSLTEEKSSWDSSALEANYAKKTWKANYSSIREQGLTIFISDSEAAWINGGIVYKLSSTGTALTKKQIKSIATSL